MAAYLIKLTTLFGSSAFSVHLAAILMSVLMSLAIFKLTSNLFNEKTAFWTTVSINFAFIYALGGLIITPDVPMLLFWVLSMYACYEISKSNGAFWWILLGIFVGAGFISKYPMVFAGLGAFVFFVSSRERIKWFLTPWPYLSLISAIIVALPVIIWNYQHDWSSFLFQTQRRAGEMARFRPDYFFGFIGTIIGIYGIIPIPILIAGIWNSVKDEFKEKSTAYLFHFR
jgi:4-amino-4-deoxy-L-arabinose transferase-like glycosyltransferase